MATHLYELSAPVIGESPYVDLITDAHPGNDTIKIVAGRREDLVPQHWELVRGVYRFDADANAADRKMIQRLYAVYGPAAVDILMSGFISANNITANQTASLFYVPDLGYVSLYYYSGDTATQGVKILDRFNFFKDLDYLTFVINNGLAGDTHKVVMTFKYLNHIQGITQRC